MGTLTILYIVIAMIIALLLALFQYGFRAKNRLVGKYLVLFILRTLSVFAILLLIINPKFQQTTFYNIKPSLVVAIDNSESVVHLERDKEVSALVATIKSNKELQEKFNIEYYTFGSDLSKNDSLDFKENKSNIAMVFDRLAEVYTGEVAPTMLITDGNQTFGRDYILASRSYNQNIFPVVLGDTTVFTDLKIQQLNANKYSFLNNKFPVEIIVVYNGSETVNSKLNIRNGSAIVYSEPLEFSGSINSKVVNFTLPATSVGISKYRAEIVPLNEEKNKINNYKDFAVEVINQKTNVAIVSDFIHPDLGAIKQSIESNKQRNSKILKPKEFIEEITDFQMVVLYQPTQNFKQIYEVLEKTKMNRLVILGPKTSYQSLNSFQSYYKQEVTNQSEDYQPLVNSNYSIFSLERLNFSDYPPLRSEFGALSFSQPINVLLYKTLNGINLNEALMATYEVGGYKEGLINGEGLWKWRAQSYRSNGDFNTFDDFVGKVVQYLSSNQPRSRLTINNESIYRETDEILITAQYFNEGYEFDSNAVVNISLKNTETQELYTFPLVINNSNYQIDLSGLLPPGEYDFTVSVKDQKLSRSSQLSILDYNVEQQFLNADVTGLGQIAENSGGASYFIDNATTMIDDLIKDNRFSTIQKSSKNIVPLIDWKYLLAIIILSLALEWFIRKYNGLI